jgi:hypothetical protein
MRFSHKEEVIVKQFCEENASILNRTSTRTDTQEQKREIWESLARKLNVLNPTVVRSVNELRKKWQNMKFHKDQAMCTSGSPPFKICPAGSETIASTMPQNMIIEKEPIEMHEENTQMQKMFMKSSSQPFTKMKLVPISTEEGPKMQQSKVLKAQQSKVLKSQTSSKKRLTPARKPIKWEKL